MHRSGSSTRVPEDFYSTPVVTGRLRLSLPGCFSKRLSIDQLPKYNPLSDVGLKESARTAKSSSEKSVHIIPVVLILCALMLWLFSSPHVGFLGKDHQVIAENKNLRGILNGTSVISRGTDQEDVARHVLLKDQKEGNYSVPR